MFDSIKKTFFSTMGIAYLTKEKVREIGKKYIEDMNLSEEEGKKFFDELVKKTDDTRLSLEKLVGDIIEKMIKKLDIPTRLEVSDLKKRLDILEKKSNK